MRTFLPIAFLALPIFLSAYVSPGNPTGFVNDYAGLFSAEEKTTLEGNLSQFEQESSNEIVVVTITSLQGDTIENYAVKLFEEWGVGKEKNDNGLLLLIALEDREMRIEVGYGLEGAVPDATASNIIRNILTPAFRNGEYYGGVSQALGAMIDATRGEYMASEPSAASQLPWEAIIYFLLFVPIWVSSVLARSKSWWAGGVVGGVIALIVTVLAGFLFVGLLSFALLIPLGLLFDFLVSRAYQKRAGSGADIPWWIGGGGKGGGFGGGGFGGFGGGMSGGGGASGRW